MGPSHRTPTPSPSPGGARLRAQGSSVKQRASQGTLQQGQAPQGGSGFWLWVPSGLRLQDDIRFNTTQSRGSRRPRTVRDHSGGSQSSPGRPVRGPQRGQVTATALRFSLPKRHARAEIQARINLSRTHSPSKSANQETHARLTLASTPSLGGTQREK